MVTVTAFIKHGYISKLSQAEPYTAVAHARYITRPKETSHVYSYQIPKQYHARERFLKTHEDGLRKNGRILDRFIISIPHDVSEQQAVKALREFGWRLGHGRAPFMFSLQGFEGRNHHAHFIFLDRDIETGRRVFGTTLRDSSAMIKLEWELAANGTFEREGLDVRVKVHDGLQEEVEADNDNLAPSQEADPYAPIEEVEVAQPEEESPADEAEDADDGEEEVADPYIDYGGIKAENALQAHRELQRLRSVQTQLHNAQTAYQRAAQEAEVAAAQCGQALNASMLAEQSFSVATAQMAQHLTAGGKLKGMRIGLGRLEVWKSARRKDAERQALAVQQSQSHFDRARQTLAEHQHAVQRFETSKTEWKRRETELQAGLNLYGSGEDLQKAEQLFENTVRRNMNALTMVELRQLYEAKEIGQDDYRELLALSGDREAIEAFEAEQSKGDGVSL